MFSRESGMQILGILGSELVIEEVLDRNMRALMSFWVIRLAVRTNERSIAVIFKAECIDLASRVGRTLDFLTHLKLAG